MRILLAVDGSPSSLDAVMTFVKHLDWFRDPPPAVRLVTVHLPVPKVGGMSKVVSHEMIEKHYREEGEKAQADAIKLLETAKVKHSTVVLVGQPAESIVAEADKDRCDLIYMGTRGLGAVSNLFMGSVATKVLHLSKVPVILVK
jgi:nucleotide-binding universal stress UspA family protein